ncbi:MAG: hypothetical protein IKO11_00365, partial [Lachnospiraceae bacterium]|nr:hypothetical protein [Lachnospiraceae bacterium]
MKKRRSVNRLLTMLLAIVMVIELLPAGLKVQAMSAGCGSGTEADPVVVHTFAELKEALESEEDLYIRVDEFENSEGKNYYELDPADCHKFLAGDFCAITIVSGKHLELNSLIDIRAKDETISYLIGNRGELTVYGNGGIVFSIMSKNPTSCVLSNYAGGQMSVWGNVSIEGKNDRADGSCAAIYAEANYTATDIRGGSFKGAGLAAVALDQDLVGKVTISGGHFENGTAGKPALYIFRDTDLKLSGGTFKGIEMESGGTAADLFAYLVEDYLYLINGDEPEDGTGLTKLEGDVVVYGDIPVVDVSIAFPRNGNKAADPVVTTKDVVLQNGSVKWERFDGDSRVAMGAEESFVAGEKYRVTFSVEDLEETHNIFPPITAPCPVWVNGHRITELDEGSDRYHYVIHYDFTASPVYIHSTNVNVEVPKAGAAPKDAVSTTEHVSVTKTEWAKWDNAEDDWVMMQPADTFEAGNDYRVLVTVAADEGCRISVNPGGSFNEDTEGTVLSVNAGEYRYYTSFNVPGAAGTVIEAINVNVAEPLAGALPADAVSATEHVTVTETLWGTYTNETDWTDMTAGETFEEGRVYHLKVTVETESGYEIGAHPVLSFNTSTEAHVINRSNTVIDMAAEFTATEK